MRKDTVINAVLKDYYVTDHAQKRMQQRGISVDVAKFIVQNGKSNVTHNAGVIHFVSNKMLKKYSSNPVIKKYGEQIKNTGVVCNREGVIITVQKLTKKMHSGWTQSDHRKLKRQKRSLLDKMVFYNS